MSKETSDGTARIEALLTSLVKLQMGPILDRELNDDFSKKLWPLVGKAKRRDIMKKLKCSPNKITEKFARWEQLGLVVRKNGYNYEKIV
jgi:hypothetical protein